MSMKWDKILEKWESGDIPIMPTQIKKPFIWRTSVISSKKNLTYREEFIEKEELNTKRQDLKTFKIHFDKAKNKYATSFPNLSGDTTLVVPVPKKGKQFNSIYHFINNASEIQQKETWKLVVKEIKNMLKNNEYIWVSTHGTGVNYLHIRISNSPKYYENSKLKKIYKN